MVRSELLTVPEDLKNKLEGLYFSTSLLGDDGPKPEFVAYYPSGCSTLAEPFILGHTDYKLPSS
jgi:hypothetical protein